MNLSTTPPPHFVRSATNNTPAQSVSHPVTVRHQALAQRGLLNIMTALLPGYTTITAMPLSTISKW
jgi:hypothetical protein